METRTEVLAHDSFGRAVKIRHYRDLAIADDDVCEEYDFAASPQGDRLVLDAVSTHSVTDCAKPLAVVRFRYDDLPQGLLKTGLSTHTILQRRHAQSGALLAQIQLESRAHDPFGNVVRRERQRNDGVRFTEESTFDIYGMLAHTIRTSASDAAVTLETGVTYDQAARAYIYTDEQGQQWKLAMDGFGRPRSVSTFDGPTEVLLEETVYVDNPLQVGGRRVTTRTYHASGSGSSAATEETTFIDGLGRSLYTEQALVGFQGRGFNNVVKPDFYVPYPP
jgi:hypothetical protein